MLDTCKRSMKLLICFKKIEDFCLIKHANALCHKQVSTSVRDWKADASSFSTLEPSGLTSIVDSNNKSCALVFPNYIRGDDLIINTEAVRSLIKDYDSIPAIKPRHIPPNLPETKWGAYNFGAWYENGGKTGHMLSPSKDTQGGLHSCAVEDFYIHTTRLSNKISALLEAFQPEVHQKYRKAVECARQFCNLSTLLPAEREAYLYLNLRICIKPGTVVFLPLYLLAHYMMEIEGDE
ncbi:hypothetical protein AKO1_006499, partial [Acrasis kona]